MSTYSLSFTIQVGENQSPSLSSSAVNAQYERSREYSSLSSLLDRLEHIARETGLMIDSEEQEDTIENTPGGILFDGGGPMTTRVKRLVIAGAASSLLLQAIETATPIIKEYIEMRGGSSFTFRDGTQEFTVKGVTDFEKVLETLRSAPTPAPVAAPPLSDAKMGPAAAVNTAPTPRAGKMQ